MTEWKSCRYCGVHGGRSCLSEMCGAIRAEAEAKLEAAKKANEFAARQLLAVHEVNQDLQAKLAAKWTAEGVKERIMSERDAAYDRIASLEQQLAAAEHGLECYKSDLRQTEDDCRGYVQDYNHARELLKGADARIAELEAEVRRLKVSK